MAEWRTCCLGDVITLKRGYDLPKRKRVDGSVPIVSSSGVSGFHNDPKVNAPGVVTGRYGTLGEVFFLERSFWPLNTTLYVKDFRGNAPRFIHYFLKTLNLPHLNAAGAVPGLNRNHLHKLEVMVPPLPTQRRIASILSAYDDLIENNQRRIRILEEMAQNLYREWFVKFRFPGHEQVNIVDSPLGQIPEGWEVKTLGDFVTLKRGYDLPKRKRVAGRYPIVSSSGITGYHAEPKVDGPGVVTGRYGTLGEVFLVKGKFWPLNTTLYVRDFHGNEPLFVWYFLRMLDLARLNAAGAVPGLNRNHLHRIAVLSMPPSLQERFAATACIHAELVDSLHRRSEVLRQTRDLLLPRLISGQVDVPAAEVEVARE